MSTFSGINLTSKALTAAQRSLEVTGQNIANVNTPGYSRQRVDQTEAVVGESGFWARKDVPGDGVDVTGIARITDAFVDATKRQDSATSSELTTTNGVWNDIELSLGEGSGAGLTSRLSKMYKAWSDLGNAQGDDAVTSARTQVVANSQSVIDTLKTLHGGLEQQWGNLKDQVGVLGDDVNATAARVADLNQSIRKAVNAGSSPNELMDQRDEFVNHLSELTGARVTLNKDSTVDVYLGNAVLVSGDLALKVGVGASSGSPATATDPAFLSLEETKNSSGKVFLKVGDVTVVPASGKLKATLDAVNSTIPKVARSYDTTAESIAGAVNDIFNQAGGPNPPPAPGFFTFAAGSAAATLSLTYVTGSQLAGKDSVTGVDRTIAKQLGELPEGASNPSTTWRGTVTGIASSAAAAESRSDLAAQVSLRSTADRESVSGVNIDEEMVNLVNYQHAYNAAAKVLSAINDSLDTLINMVR